MLRTDAKTLGAALSRALPAVQSGRTTIPILSTARLTAEAGVLTVSGTNLDMQIDADALVEVTREARAAINPRQVLGILRYLPKLDRVEVNVEGEAVFLSWPGGKARVASLPAGDFPDLKTHGEAIQAQIGEEDYAAFTRVMPFVSDEETRYYLNGVCLDVVDGIGVAVATDGHRLASMPISKGLTAIPSILHRVIMPRNSVRMLLGVHAGDAQIVFHRVNDSSSTFELNGDGIRLRSKLIDGAFPDWKRVLPREAKLELEVSRADLIRSCALASQFVGTSHREVVLVADGGRVQLQAKHYDQELAIDVGPAPLRMLWEVPINAHLLQRVISAVRGTTATLRFLTTSEPLQVTGSDHQPGENVVVMPLRHGPIRSSFSAPLRDAA